MAEQVEETAINYHLSAIVADDGHHHRGTIRAGDVAPEATMEDGSSLHEVLAERTGHTYLHVAESPPASMPSCSRPAARWPTATAWAGRHRGHPARRLRGSGGLQGR